MSIVDKITIFCTDVNKRGTSIELLEINIIRYFVIKKYHTSTAGVKTFVTKWNKHYAFAYALKFDELF